MSELNDRTLAEDSAVIPHWHDPDGTRLTLAEGEGVTVEDTGGTSYLDFTSQLYCVNAGHDNQAIIDAISRQTRRLPYVSSAKDNDVRARLADRLSQVAPGSLEDVVFSVSGSESNELAVQFARKYTDATKILTRYQSYHGSTYASGGLTGDPATRSTVESHASTTGMAKFLPPLPACFDADSESELAEAAADHVEYVIRQEDPDSIAAILMEPVAGSCGAYTAPAGYFERLREICDEYEILLITDEVITGFGRCGEWFGVETEDVEPDMITFAKGVTSSYAPLGGVIMQSEIGEFVRDGIDFGQTFAGHPVSCAAGLAAIDQYENHLIENVRNQAPLLRRRLEEIESAHEEVATVRGRGLLWSVVFRNPETGAHIQTIDDDTDGNPVDDVIGEAKQDGVLYSSGRPNTQIMVAPPLCVDETEIEQAMAVLDSAIATTFA